MTINLWLINLYLAANILIFLAFLAFSWLFFDAYKNSRKKCHLLRGLGGLIIAISFFVNIISKSYLIYYINDYKIIFILQFIGLVITLFGYKVEEIPGLPKLEDLKKTKTKIKKKERKEKSYLPFFAIPFSFVNLLISVGIIIIIHYKYVYGKSKEYRLILYFWIGYALFTLIEFFSVIGSENFVWIDNLFRQYSIFWIISQIILIAITAIMFFWIYRFIVFRVLARIFFGFWQLIIILSVILATVYSAFIIKDSEEQVLSLLNKNAKLVNYNLEQIENNNKDLVNLLSSKDDLVYSVKNKNNKDVEIIIDNFVKNNNNLDRVLVTDGQGNVIYNSERFEETGTSYINNSIIEGVIKSQQGNSNFLAEEIRIPAKRLVLQTTKPIFENDIIVGTVSLQKRIDDNYLDYLKKQTEQELMVYLEGKRTASTVLDDDNLSRAENLPEPKITNINYNKNEDIKIEFGSASILAKPYHLAYFNIKNRDDEDLAKIYIGTEQSLLINTTQKTLLNTFLVAVLLNLLATIPCYYLAKSLEKNLSV